MQTVSLNLGQIIATLDPLHHDAYDVLQRELMERAISAIGRAKWDKVFDSDEWTINMNLVFNEVNTEDV